MRVVIGRDEWYPVYFIEKPDYVPLHKDDHAVDLSDEMVEEIRSAFEAFGRAQDSLRAAWTPADRG